MPSTQYMTVQSAGDRSRSRSPGGAVRLVDKSTSKSRPNPSSEAESTKSLATLYSFPEPSLKTRQKNASSSFLDSTNSSTKLATVKSNSKSAACKDSDSDSTKFSTVKPNRKNLASNGSSENDSSKFFTVASENDPPRKGRSRLDRSNSSEAFLTLPQPALRKRSRSRDARIVESAVANMPVKKLKNPELEQDAFGFARKRSNDVIQAHKENQTRLGGKIALKITAKDLKILTVLGRGGFGCVTKVQHASGKIYALKSMNRSVDEKYVEAEIKVMSECSHLNMVHLYGWFSSDNKKTVNLVMEYCEGGDLDTYLKRQTSVLMCEKKILEWFHQIVSAILYMHGKNIMHRDLKPLNILLFGPDHLKVADFGISKILGPNDAAVTRIGTPLYMAPEIWSRGNAGYSYGSDIWSLGCVLVNMATLKSCFEDPTAHLEARTRKISSKYIVVPGLVSMCIQICPKKRANARQVLVAINSTSKSQ